MNLDVSVLYSNKKYLDLYKKPVPKTWEELIETTNYILDKERELNNTNIVGYNGLFSRKNKIFFLS